VEFIPEKFFIACQRARKSASFFLNSLIWLAGLINVQKVTFLLSLRFYYFFFTRRVLTVIRDQNQSCRPASNNWKNQRGEHKPTLSRMIKLQGTRVRGWGFKTEF